MRKVLVLVCIFAVLFPLAAFADEAELSDEEEEDEAKILTNDTQRLQFTAPKCPQGSFICAYFDSASDLGKLFVASQARKDGVASEIAKYDGIWSVEVPETAKIDGDFGLVLKTKARHHAVSSKFAKPFTLEKNTDQLVMQYEVKFQNGMECGGAYVKLLTDSSDLDLKNFNDKTPYTIMFGPDKCGQDHKLHFILRHRNPVNGEIEEKHSKRPKGEIEGFFSDKKTHLYTLVINTDNSFEIYVDRGLISSGNLLEDLEPAINPPREIDDPSDKKPEKWDDREKIADPAAFKPADWDENEPEFIPDADAKKPEGWLDNEPLTIPDPTATKPKDWDEDMDGSWEAAQIDNPVCKSAPGCGTWKAPQIKNPKYRGKWSAPMIDNKDYQGVWKPRRISNPNYFEDKEPWRVAPIGALGLELWSMSDAIVFDNFLLVNRKSAADAFADATFNVKQQAERQADPSSLSVVDAVRDATRDKPWIWAVLLLVVVLPTVLIIVYCCMGGKKDEAAIRKKTDAPSPTSKASLEDEEAEESEGENEGEGDANAEEEEEDAGADAGPASGDNSGPRRRVPRKD